MSFPSTEAGLKAEGYQFAGTSLCKGCHARIEWWITPTGKRMPLNPVTFIAHHATCPNAKDFRKK